MKWLPNAVSIARLCLSPLIAWLIWEGMSSGEGRGMLMLAFWLFTVSALTDWLDGWLARTLDAKSELGGKLDLWGDKLLVGLTAPALCLGWLALDGEHPNLVDGMIHNPALAALGVFLLLALPGRDLLVTRLRARAEAEGRTIPPTFAAKSKTAVVMTGLAVWLAGLGWGWPLATLAGVSITVTGAALSIWTGLAYVGGPARQR
jgi:phosphatidylglycerophosphate synthase